jgi:hypothetical protein
MVYFQANTLQLYQLNTAHYSKKFAHIKKRLADYPNFNQLVNSNSQHNQNHTNSKDTVLVNKRHIQTGFLYFLHLKFPLL